MQAITIAIGKNGIDFFAHQLVADELVRILSNLRPPDKTIPVPDIIYMNGANKAADIAITLSNGSLQGFNPQFQGISQQANGVFPLAMGAGGFNANYNWHEYWRAYIYFPNRGGGGSWSEALWSPVNNNYGYSPAFSGMTINIPLQFEYENQSWSVVAGNSTGNAVSSAANIPGDSVIQHEDESCYVGHISAATSDAISSIDFGSSLNSLLSKTIASIPGSGDLGNGIKYDFSLASPQSLLFPDNDGIQMGVRGGASYNGTAFSGVKPPDLPLPAVPADSDSHHLNMYVSNYEIDALYWAFFEAGKLNVVVNADDLQDPKVLKVATYTSYEQSLKPYEVFAMQAQISPAEAPLSSFQTYWDFTASVLASLQKQLPSDVYDPIATNLEANVYTSQASLEADLTALSIPSTWFPQIEEAASFSGMVVNNNLNFDLIIQTGKPDPPNIKFTVERSDILSNLALGVGANSTQTMQFTFTNVTYSATFVSSTVPGFKGGDSFGNDVWGPAGEPGYEDVLAAMGKNGVPLPIMADFQFDFTNAELNIENGLISISANVLYKSKKSEPPA